MKMRASEGPLESQYLAMDDASFDFGWPQNRDSLWGTIGGWGYEGDQLVKMWRELEYDLHAAELVSAERFDDFEDAFGKLWKKLLLIQNHDFFIVSGYPVEYGGVRTTNFQAACIVHREVLEGIHDIRKALHPAAEVFDHLVVQNATQYSGALPVIFEAPQYSSCELVAKDRTYACQLWDPAAVPPKFVSVLPLQPFGISSFVLNEARSSQNLEEQTSPQGIANQFYSVDWNTAEQAFAVKDKHNGQQLLFGR